MAGYDDLRVIKAEVQENGDGLVVVESDSPSIIRSPRARKLAYNMRTKLGMGRAGISGSSNAYIVYLDEDGEEVDRDYEGKKRIVHRTDFTLTQL